MPRWDEIRDDLFEAYIAVSPPLTKEQQEELTGIMRARGHDMVWNAIRYLLVPSLLQRGSSFSTFPEPVMGNTTHSWTAEAEQDLLRVLNTYYRPNAEDCKTLAAALKAKGYTVSENGLLLRGQLCTNLKSQVSSLEMASKPTNWDHDAHLALLQAIIENAPPTQFEWEPILEAVGRKGYAYTASAAL
ncbi:hypothetical protein B0T16DRAFT_453833 [Cercophora newfieldiana]|uniref:Uncharacterized protein n=1 Tax=Cercophora newfieldiana TaxID=92897 RepID=A0AA39YH31_9PEZI|nr:hypothetical protein B0T16DRAFT_453833 [Cercophora newfieldiana]